jgi:hypothetical protein
MKDEKLKPCPLERSDRGTFAAKLPEVVDGQVCWRCGKCGHWIPEDGFYRSSRYANGLRSQCKRCDRENRQKNPEAQTYSRNWYARNAERRAQYHREYAAKYPERIRAKEEVRTAIAAGVLIRPSFCEGCGEDCSPDAHHWDYSRPLDVEWLCKLCHAGAHRSKS